MRSAVSVQERKPPCSGSGAICARMRARAPHLSTPGARATQGGLPRASSERWTCDVATWARATARKSQIIVLRLI